MAHFKCLLGCKILFFVPFQRGNDADRLTDEDVDYCFDKLDLNGDSLITEEGNYFQPALLYILPIFVGSFNKFRITQLL